MLNLCSQPADEIFTQGGQFICKKMKIFCRKNLLHQCELSKSKSCTCLSVPNLRLQNTWNIALWTGCHSKQFPWTSRTHTCAHVIHDSRLIEPGYLPIDQRPPGPPLWGGELPPGILLWLGGLIWGDEGAWLDPGRVGHRGRDPPRFTRAENRTEEKHVLGSPLIGGILRRILRGSMLCLSCSQGTCIGFFCPISIPTA